MNCVIRVVQGELNEQRSVSKGSFILGYLGGLDTVSRASCVFLFEAKVIEGYRIVKSRVTRLFTLASI